MVSAQEVTAEFDEIGGNLTWNVSSRPSGCYGRKSNPCFPGITHAILFIKGVLNLR